jgi:hypothetical protein
MSRIGLASFAIILSLVFIPAAMPTPAEAVTINVNIGTNINSGRGISCSQGERLLRNRGFRDVRRVDCFGRHFVYRAWRGRSRFEISVRSRDARVVDLRRIRG